jgi:hypothetical protein
MLPLDETVNVLGGGFCALMWRRVFGGCRLYGMVSIIVWKLAVKLVCSRGLSPSTNATLVSKRGNIDI